MIDKDRLEYIASEVEAGCSPVDFFRELFEYVRQDIERKEEQKEEDKYEALAGRYPPES